MKKITRRAFLVSGAVVGGGLFVGYLAWPEGQRQLRAGPDESILNAWLKIRGDGTVVVVSPHVEMGQGIHTGLAALVADELDARWEDVVVEPAPVDPIYVNVAMVTEGLEESELLPEFLEGIGVAVVGGLTRLVGHQVTGGSSSIRNAYETMRLAGASAKSMLIQTAARRWGVAPEECTADSGLIHHRASGRAEGFGNLASGAGLLKPPAKPVLKDRGALRLVDSELPRLDIPAKVDGSAEFGIDVDYPDISHAAIRMPECVTGKVRSFDARKVERLTGVQAVVSSDRAVAAVARSTWEARKALEAIEIQFDDGPAARLNTVEIVLQLEAGLDGGEARVYRDEGDAGAVLAGRPGVIESTYRVPYLAHACMEPMNFTAYFDGVSCVVAGPTQVPTLVRDLVADELGIEKTKVSVVSTYLGGGFGRRTEPDVAVQAAAISAQVKRPVKLLWDREADIAQGPFRPMAMARMRAVLGEDGLPVALHGRSTSQSVNGNYMRRWLPALASDEPDSTSVEGFANMPYEIGNRRLEHVVQDLPVPVGFWRSVGNSFNAFFVESFIDELAAKAGENPFDYRRRMLKGHPRIVRVLDELQDLSDFSAQPGPGIGRGLAVHSCFGSIVGEVVEVRTEGDDIRVDKVSCVVDCGDVVHPDSIRGQMEGSILFGLSAALRGQITFRNGRARQSNFHNYELLSMADAPEIQTRIIRSGARLGGIGEPGTPPVAPALCNAIFAATGRRHRNLPLIGSHFDEPA